MLNDTLATIENQFFDGLKAVQDPTIDAARQAADLVAKIPFPEPATELIAKLPTAEEIVSRNFAFAQRLLDAQRDFVVELVGATAVPSTSAAPTKKKSAA